MAFRNIFKTDEEFTVMSVIKIPTRQQLKKSLSIKPSQSILFFLAAIISVPLFLKYLVIGDTYIRNYTSLLAVLILFILLIIKKRINLGISPEITLFVLLQLVIEFAVYGQTSISINSLLSQGAGLVVGLVLINVNLKLSYAALVCSLMLLIASQSLESLDLLPTAVNGSPFDRLDGNRFHGLGYVNDNGLLYGMFFVYMYAASQWRFLALISYGLFINKTGSSILSLVSTLGLAVVPKRRQLIFISLILFPLTYLILYSASSYIVSDRFNSLIFRFLLWSTAVQNYEFDVLQAIFGIGIIATRELTLPLQFGTVHFNWLGIFFSYGLIGLIINFSIIKKIFLQKGGALLAIFLFFHGITHEFYYSAPILTSIIVIYSLLSYNKIKSV